MQKSCSHYSSLSENIFFPLNKMKKPFEVSLCIYSTARGKLNGTVFVASFNNVPLNGVFFWRGKNHFKFTFTRHCSLFNVAWFFALRVKYTYWTTLQTFQHQTLAFCLVLSALSLLVSRYEKWQHTSEPGESDKFKERLRSFSLQPFSRVISVESVPLKKVDKMILLPVERLFLSQHARTKSGDSIESIQINLSVCPQHFTFSQNASKIFKYAIFAYFPINIFIVAS